VVSGTTLRVAFFGTPAFAVPTLDALLASRHTVAGVVTQPDRPRGRGQKITDAPVKARAVERGIAVLQPERLRDARFLETFRAWSTDLAVVAAYGKILSDELLAVPRLGMINVHASLLPRYRGAAPVHRAVMAGESDTGVTIMRVVKALDAGPMLAKARRPIGADETSDDVERDLARVGAALLIQVADAMSIGPVGETPQDDSHATYAPRLTKDEGAIDWSASAERIHNLVRGLHPWPHAFTFHRGRRFIIRRTSFAKPPHLPHPPDLSSPGLIVAAADDDLVVQTGAGAIRIVEIQAEGKRPMTAREFLAGHPLEPGTAFGAR
jgi:methionyl-tRNA formyltransferase